MMNLKTQRLIAILVLLCLALAEAKKLSPTTNKILDVIGKHQNHGKKPHHDKKNDVVVVDPKDEDLVPEETDEGHPEGEPVDPGFVDEETDAEVTKETTDAEVSENEGDEGHPEDEPTDPGFIDEETTDDEKTPEEGDDTIIDDEDDEDDGDNSQYENMD